MANNDPAKEIVVTRIAGDKQWRKLPSSKWIVGDKVLHIRFVTNPKGDGVSYAYDTNPNMLSAHFAVWICGNTNDYYLIPIAVIRGIQEDPAAYRNISHHPTHRVISVNTRSHEALFAPGSSLDFGQYFQKCF